MKTNWQDPQTSEIRSTHIAGLMDAVGKIEDVLDLKLQAETNVPLTEVYISEQDRYRIYQAPAGKRNWASSPAPVIKKNGVVVSSGFTIDYGGGAIIVSPSATSTDTFTADVSYTKTGDNALESHKADYATFKNNTNAEIVEIKKKIGIVHNIESWAEVQEIVRRGLAPTIFKIGDQLVADYDGSAVVWDIIGFDHDIPTDTNYTHSMTIQAHDCIMNIQFDAPEPTNPDTNRQQYGSNNYMESAIRQWLNSNESQFNWVAKTQYDEPPTSSNYNGAGFLYNLDQELVAVLGAVDKQVACNTVTDGGGQDTFSDKIFLLSRVEVGVGTEGVTDGEVVYPYYDGISDAGRIKLLNNSPRYWWLRSPAVGYSHHVRIVRPTGAVDSNDARNANGLSPACCII